jgi:CBS domain-containing protein
MKVDEVMTRDPAYCRRDDTLARASQLMWERDCGCIPVVDDEARVVGIVTDRDVTMAAFHGGGRLDDLPVSRAMAKAPVTIGPKERISEALHVMGRGRVRRLPVIDASGRLVGVLSLHDLARSASEEHRWFSGVTMREVAKTFAEVSRPRSHKPPMPRNNAGYAV